MKHFFKTVLFLLLPFFFQPAFAAGTAYEDLPADLRLLTKSGMDAVYSVRLEDAEKYFGEALAKYPSHPFPHFGLAMVQWAKLEYLEDESSPELENSYSKMTDEAIEIGKKWLKAHPGDANAHLCMGGMYGLRARLAVMQHRWLKAYSNGRKALKSMKRSLEINDKLYDSYLGLGMYEYYAGTLKGVVKILASVLMPGDASKGIEMLKLCREKGYFNSTAAELLLIEIFTQTNSKYADPATAVKWSVSLRRRYPDHPQMHFVEIVSLYENKEYDRSLSECLEYLRQIEAGNPVYRRRYLPRITTAIGTNFLVKGDYASAVRYYRMSEETVRQHPDQPPARWAVWGIVRLGNVYDIEGKREKALECYREAGKFGDGWGFGEYIKEYIKSPYSAGMLPGALPPP